MLLIHRFELAQMFSEQVRWFEPFIDYGPDCDRATTLYDATLVLGHRARELLSREGVREPEGLLASRLCERVCLTY